MYPSYETVAAQNSMHSLKRASSCVNVSIAVKKSASSGVPSVNTVLKYGASDLRSLIIDIKIVGLSLERRGITV